MAPLRLSTLRGTKHTLLTPTMYDEQPRHFYMAVPPTFVTQYCSSLEQDLHMTPFITPK